MIGQVSTSELANVINKSKYYLKQARQKKLKQQLEVQKLTSLNEGLTPQEQMMKVHQACEMAQKLNLQISF